MASLNRSTVYSVLISGTLRLEVHFELERNYANIQSQSITHEYLDKDYWPTIWGCCFRSKDLLKSPELVTLLHQLYERLISH